MKKSAVPNSSQVAASSSVLGTTPPTQSLSSNVQELLARTFMLELAQSIIAHAGEFVACQAKVYALDCDFSCLNEKDNCDCFRVRQHLGCR